MRMARVLGHVFVMTIMSAAGILGRTGAGAVDGDSRGGIVAAESRWRRSGGADSGARRECGGRRNCDDAMMGVVEPMMNGIGGDLFAIVYDAKANKLYGLNASGWAPKGLTIEFLQKQGLRDMPQSGVHAITVPGRSMDGRSWRTSLDGRS